MSPTKNQRLLDNFSADEITSFLKKTEAEQKSDLCGVYFYGGEPTVVMGDIVKLSKKLRSSIKPLELVLHTNGLLLDRVPKYVLSNLDHVFVSINSELVVQDGRLSDYYLKVVKNLATAREFFDGSAIARLTITSNSSLYAETMRSLGLFDFVYWQLENRLSPHPFKGFASQYLKEFELLVSFWWQMIEESKVFGVLPFINWAAQGYGLEPPFKSFPCDAGKDVFVATDGNCFICPEMLGDKAVYCGSVREGVDLSRMRELIKPRKECLQCKFFGYCGGRCLRMHLKFPKKHKKTYCRITRNSLKLFFKHLNEHPFESLSKQTQKQLMERIPFTSLCEKVP